MEPAIHNGLRKREKQLLTAATPQSGKCRREEDRGKEEHKGVSGSLCGVITSISCVHLCLHVACKRYTPHTLSHLSFICPLHTLEHPTTCAPLVLQGDLEARQRAIRELEAAGAKVLGGDQGRQRRVTEIQNEVSRLEMSIMAAKAEYDRIRAANLQVRVGWHGGGTRSTGQIARGFAHPSFSQVPNQLLASSSTRRPRCDPSPSAPPSVQELVRVQGEMRVDFSHMLRMYCLAQAASAERLLEVWLQAGGELGAGAQELADAKAAYLGEGGPSYGAPSGSGGGAGASS